MNNDNVKETKKDLMNILIPELEKCDEEDKTLLKGIVIGMRIKAKEIKINNDDKKNRLECKALGEKI